MEQLWFGNLSEREQNLLKRVALFEGRVEALEALKTELAKAQREAEQQRVAATKAEKDLAAERVATGRASVAP